MELQNYFRKIEKVISQLQKQITKSNGFFSKALNSSKTTNQQKVFKKMLNQCKIIIQAKNFTSKSLNQLFKEILVYKLIPILCSNSENSFDDIHISIKKIIFMLKIHTIVYQILLLLPSTPNETILLQIFNQSLSYLFQNFKQFFNLLQRTKKQRFQTTTIQKLLTQISLCILHLCPKIYELFTKAKENFLNCSNSIDHIILNYIKFNFLIQLASFKPLTLQSKQNLHNQNHGKSTLNIQHNSKSKSNLQRSFISENAKSVDQQNLRQKNKIFGNISNLLGKQKVKKQQKSLRLGFIKQTQQKIIKFYFSQAIGIICNSEQQQKYKIAIILIKEHFFTNSIQISQKQEYCTLLMSIIRQLTLKINKTCQYEMFLTLLKNQIEILLDLSSKNELKVNRLCKLIDLLVQNYQKIMNQSFQSQPLNYYQQNPNLEEIQQSISNEQGLKNVNEELIVIITKVLKKCSKQSINCESLNTILTIHQIFCNQVNFNSSSAAFSKTKPSKSIFKENYICLQFQLISIFAKAFKFNQKSFQGSFNFSWQQYIKFLESFVEILIQSLDTLPSQLQEIIFLSSKNDLKLDKFQIQQNLRIFDIFLDYITHLYIEIFRYFNKNPKELNRKNNYKLTFKLNKSFQNLCKTGITLKFKSQNIQQKHSENKMLFVQHCQKKVLNGILMLCQCISKQKFQFQIVLNVVSIVQKILNIFIPSTGRQSTQVNCQKQENNFSRIVIQNISEKWFDGISLLQLIKICQKIQFLCVKGGKNKQNELQTIKLAIIQNFLKLNLYPTEIQKSNNQIRKKFRINTESLLEIAIQNMSKIKNNFLEEGGQKIDFQFIFLIFLKTFESIDKEQNKVSFNYVNWLLEQREYLQKLFLVIQIYSHNKQKNSTQNINQNLSQIYQITDKINHLLIKIIFSNVIESLNLNDFCKIQSKIQFLDKNICSWTNICSVSWLQSIILNFQKVKIKNCDIWPMVQKFLFKMTLNLHKSLQKEKENRTLHKKKQNISNLVKICYQTKVIEKSDVFQKKLQSIIIKIEQLKIIQKLSIDQLNQWKQLVNCYKEANDVLLIKLMIQKNEDVIIIRQYQTKLINSLQNFIQILHNKGSNLPFWTMVKKMLEFNLSSIIHKFKNQTQFYEKFIQLIRNISFELNSRLIRQFDKLKVKQSIIHNDMLQTPCFKRNINLNKKGYNQGFQNVFEHEIMEVIQQNSIQQIQIQEEKQLIVSELEIDIQSRCSKESQQQQNITSQSLQSKNHSSNFELKLQRLKLLIKLTSSWIIDCKNNEGFSHKNIFNSKNNKTNQNQLKQQNQINLQEMLSSKNFFSTTQIVYSLIINKHLYQLPFIFQVFLEMWIQCNRVYNIKDNGQCNKFVEILKEYVKIIKLNIKQEQKELKFQINCIKRIIIILQTFFNQTLEQTTNLEEFLENYICLLKQVKIISCLVYSFNQKSIQSIQFPNQPSQQPLNQKIQTNIEFIHELLIRLLSEQISKSSKLYTLFLKQQNLMNISELPNNKVLKKCADFIYFLQNQQNLQLNKSDRKTQFALKKVNREYMSNDTNKQIKRIKKQIKAINLRELIQKKQYQKILVLIQFQRKKIIQCDLMSFQFENMLDKIKTNTRVRNQFFFEVLEHILLICSSQYKQNQVELFNLLSTILQNLVIIILELEDITIQKVALKIIKIMKQIVQIINRESCVLKNKNNQIQLLRQKGVMVIVSILKIYLQKRLNLIQECKQLNIQLSIDIKTNIKVVFEGICEAIYFSNKSILKNDNQNTVPMKNWIFNEFFDLVVDFLNVVSSQTNLILKNILKSLKAEPLQKTKELDLKKNQHHRLFTCGKIDYLQ